MTKEQKIKKSNMFWVVMWVFVFFMGLVTIPFLIKIGINAVDFEMPEEHIYEVKYKSENDTQSYFYSIRKNNLIEKINKERYEMNYYTDDDWAVSEINLIN